MDSNTWVAIGTGATALFTGFTAVMLWVNRKRPNIKAEISAMSFVASNSAEVKVTFTFLNTGTGPAYDVRTFVTLPGLPDKQHGPSVAVLPEGDSLELVRRHNSLAGPQEFDEERGERPSVPLDFDPKEMGIAITWTQPPRHRRKRDLRVRESELLCDFRARHFPLD